jgi:uncharacterized protein involved in outer membrane biogenesis
MGTIDLPAGRGTVATTLRHPGAPRLLQEALGWDVAAWLGDGSFSLVGNLALGPNLLSAESFELVAGGLRAGGQLALGFEARPRLAGRIVAERLPLPLPGLRSTDPLPLDALTGFDAEIALEAARIEAGGTVLEDASALLRLAAGRLALERVAAKLAGGRLEGGLVVDLTAAGPPRLALDVQLLEATLAAPLLGLPFDLTAGRGEFAARLAAHGHAPAALLATLSGSWRTSLRDGVLTGLDLATAVGGTGLADLAEAEAGVRRALATGATAFDRLEAAGSVEAGRVAIETSRITTESGATATLAGSADLPRATLDLRFAVRPAAAEAPDIGLRVTGPAAAPRVLPETAGWARWRAERG